MGITVRSSIAAVIIAVFIQGIAIGVISPGIPQSLCQPTLTRSFSQDYDVVKQVQLHNTNGAVKVHTHGLNKIIIQTEIKAFLHHDGTKEAVEAYFDTLIQIEERQNQLLITSEPEQRPDNLDLEINYILLVPENTNLALEESDGNVYVGSGCGRVLIDGNNTDILVEGPRGPVEVQTANGRVRISDAQDETIVETINGNIYADMRGGSLKATTANGSIVTHMLPPLKKVDLAVFERNLDKSQRSHIGGADLTAMNGGITNAGNFAAT